MTTAEIAQQYAKMPHVKKVWMKGKEIFLTPVIGAKEVALKLEAKATTVEETTAPAAEVEETTASATEVEETTTEAQTEANNIKKQKKK